MGRLHDKDDHEGVEGEEGDDEEDDPPGGDPQCGQGGQETL